VHFSIKMRHLDLVATILMIFPIIN